MSCFLFHSFLNPDLLDEPGAFKTAQSPFSSVLVFVSDWAEFFIPLRQYCPKPTNMPHELQSSFFSQKLSSNLLRERPSLLGFLASLTWPVNGPLRDSLCSPVYISRHFSFPVPKSLCQQCLHLHFSPCSLWAYLTSSLLFSLGASKISKFCNHLGIIPLPARHNP